jgi:membrane-associated protease RseP (regulator of RpoE activity)
MWLGMLFSGPLLLSLLTHEFGHFVACRYWRVDASLPYFVPSPTLFGTWGAFIRIRSPIYSRPGLFDIGISGPIAGFVVLAPFLAAGVLLSRQLPPGAEPQSFVFGTPLALRLLEWIRFGSVEPSRILLHPMAVAGWAGLLATAMNLLPIGQLDGGHILYAVFGERWHRIVSRVSIAILALLGFVYWPWWIWAVLMFFLFRRHPLVYDERPLPVARGVLCVAALLIFVLSLSIVPIRAS